MDGRYDDNTKDAVARFQREQGLKADGLLGPETLKAIQRMAGRPAGGERRRASE
jgi:peptidoglycan hydrolase-like protein with peptidoglycan-binding domain